MQSAASALPSRVAAPGHGMGTPVRGLLRNETAKQHERLHRHPYFAALLNGTLTIDAYRRLLARLFGYHVPIELSLRKLDENRLGLGKDLDQSERLHLLEQDLQDLGFSEGEMRRLPLSMHHLPLDSSAHALGVIYVLEGSALGGRLIHRHLGRLLEGRASGRRFFAGQGVAAATRWQLVCRRLEQCTDVPALIASATATFTGLADWLEGLPSLSAGGSAGRE